MACEEDCRLNSASWYAKYNKIIRWWTAMAYRDVLRYWRTSPPSIPNVLLCSVKLGRNSRHAHTGLEGNSPFSPATNLWLFAHKPLPRLRARSSGKLPTNPSTSPSTMPTRINRPLSAGARSPNPILSPSQRRAPSLLASTPSSRV